MASSPIEGRRVSAGIFGGPQASLSAGVTYAQL